MMNRILAYSFASLLAYGAAEAATMKWVGPKQPGKLTTPKTGKVNIGEFINLAKAEEWGHAVFNIHAKFPASTPWVHWGIGAWPEHNTPLTDAQHEEALAYFDKLGVSVFLEARHCQDPVAFLDAQMKKYGTHSSVKGFGFDLEFFKGGCGGAGAAVSDADAKALDEKLKTFNPNHRLFFKHWQTANMPKTYRGKGDLIFIATSSEFAPTAIWKAHADFCNTFAPGGTPTAACGAQIGYPADEPSGDTHVHGGAYDGWGKLVDPVKEWGDAFLAGVKSPTQEVGFDWVTLKSERMAWDISKGATIPSAVAPRAAEAGRFLRADRNGFAMTVTLPDGRSKVIIPAVADIQGRRVPAQATGTAAGRYFLRHGKSALAATVAR